MYLMNVYSIFNDRLGAFFALTSLQQHESFKTEPLFQIFFWLQIELHCLPKQKKPDTHASMYVRHKKAR
jgi:hypothetical protein